MPTFRAEMKGFSEAVEAYGVGPVTKAANSSLRKVAASGKTVASEEIRKRYNIKKSDLDPRLAVTPPRSNSLIAEITINGKGTSLSYFGEVEPKVLRRIEQAWETTFPHELEYQVSKVEW